jgi:hypothetical protein
MYSVKLVGFLTEKEQDDFCHWFNDIGLRGYKARTGSQRKIKVDNQFNEGQYFYIIKDEEAKETTIHLV